ncbi:MAG: hypothetical protein ACLFWD_06800, partial [Anaerolineales bacterium]
MKLSQTAKSPSQITHKDRRGFDSWRLMLLGVVLLAASLACSLDQAGKLQEEALATRVAGTLTAAAPADAETPTQEPSPTESVTSTPTEPPSQTATSTAAAPDDGVSLNCDGIFQRVRLIDQGSEGRTLIVDEWTGSNWDTRWRFDGGDPNIRQLTDRAGAYSFDSCQQLLVVPLLYTGSGAVIELRVFEWTGEGAVEVHTDNGTHGDWQIAGDRL